MLYKNLLFNRNFLLWSILAGMLFSLVALAPQIDLWKVRGENYNGVYATNEFDEPFYAAYIQSLIDNKPRRNSPYSGAKDSFETPQKESYLSIQFLASYPTDIFAKLFGLSSNSAMILFSPIIGFISAVAVFLLFYLITSDSYLSFVGTIAVLFGGTIAAGQGNILVLLSPETTKYGFSLYFLRRSVPAISFPALFLFFSFTWKFFTVQTQISKLFWGLLSICCFTFAIFSYFYHWTTALAWVFALIICYTFFNREFLRQNAMYLVGFGVCLLLVLIPYFFLLSNRSTVTDSALFLVFTHEADLWRIPELISYLTIIILYVSKKKNWVDWSETPILFLLSLSLVAPIVFNQQILTGKSLQPFHYQFTSVNYISVFSLLTIVFILVKKITPQELRKFSILLLAGALSFGCFETICGAISTRKDNSARDELFPVAERIKLLSQNSESQNNTPIILSFDFAQDGYANSIDLPALSSEAVLWGPHITMFPDVDSNVNQERLFKFLYFQNFDKTHLKKEFEKGNFVILLGFFGGGRFLSAMTSEYKPLTEQETEEIIEKYDWFCNNFNYENAQKNVVSFVILPREIPEDFSILDRWYERDTGEEVGSYRLYRVKLKNRK